MADNKELQIELVKVTEELKKHCQCFDCNDGADIQEYVGKFLRVLAQMFCWVDKTCATILKTAREEIIELGNYEICECKAIFEFKPYYFKGFDPSTVKLFLHKRQGLSREVIELDRTKWSWDSIDGTILIDMTEQINPCCQCDTSCQCETTYKLVARYEAGYTAETLPLCVYEAMCHFLQVFIAYQNNCGSLDDCSKMDRLAVGSVLKSKSVDYLIRTWDVDTASLEYIYTKLINRWALQSLSMLSLCQYENTSVFIAVGKARKHESKVSRGVHKRG